MSGSESGFRDAHHLAPAPAAPELPHLFGEIERRLAGEVRRIGERRPRRSRPWHDEEAAFLRPVAMSRQEGRSPRGRRGEQQAPQQIRRERTSPLRAIRSSLAYQIR